jgi:hypothetical protein
MDGLLNGLGPMCRRLREELGGVYEFRLFEGQLGWR